MPASLVVGASGAIGRFLLPRLVAAGHDVTALSRVRRADDAGGVRWLVGNLDHALPQLPALDTIFSCGPLDAFARWFARAPTRPARVIAFGSMSVESKRSSNDPAERALAQRLQHAEQIVMDSAAASDCEWTLLRPTLIYGAGTDRSLTPLAYFARRWRVFPRIAAANGLRQPVHADDLALACLEVATNPDSAGRTYELGGGERLTFATMLERVRASLPFRSVPVPLSLTALRVIARSTPRFPRAALDRLGSDLVADDREAVADFGWAPRTFYPDAACWFAPSGRAEQSVSQFSAD
jgi:nucleoside-diphosphate-sugar epimerase